MPRPSILVEDGRGTSEFSPNQTVVDAAKYRLLLAIEAAISICTHLAARLAQQSPDSYADCFNVLATSGIIEEELADRLARMARFRNLLVHVYEEVDHGRVWEFLQTDLEDLDAYLVQVGHAIKEKLP